MTLTQRKRLDHPEKYIRKDARKRIYRELYGISGELKGKRTNYPPTDETRRFDTFWTYQNALHIFEANKDQAEFTSNELAIHQHRLEVLRNYKPRSQADREVSEIINDYVASL